MRGVEGSLLSPLLDLVPGLALAFELGRGREQPSNPAELAIVEEALDAIKDSRIGRVLVEVRRSAVPARCSAPERARGRPR
jgi:hypothetical protein